jgi:hypothetical protein
MVLPRGPHLGPCRILAPPHPVMDGSIQTLVFAGAVEVDCLTISSGSTAISST